MIDVMEKFYEKIALLCKSSGKSIDVVFNKVLGREKGGKDVYQGWRRRGMYPRADILYKLSKLLQVPMESFFDDSPAVAGVSARMKALSSIEKLTDEEFEFVKNIVKNLINSKEKK